jgi:hypothetical protein
MDSFLFFIFFKKKETELDEIHNII